MKQNEIEKMQDEMNFQTVKENAADLLENFEKLDKKNLVKINSEYLSFEQNTEYNFIFNGITQMESQDGKKIDCCILIDKDGMQHINGSAILVNTLKRITQVPCFVNIQTGKQIRGKNGNYLDMQISVIPQSLKS